MPSPIADLSYRGYDGPLNEPKFRWWAIARTMIGISMRKRIVWVMSAFSAWYYLAMVFTLYVMDLLSAQVPEGAPSPSKAFFDRIVWKDQFLHGLSYGQMLFLFVALILGAGAMANDNRANALLVYLSKPVTKLDYLAGKWMGIFIPMVVIMLAPSLLFYGYCIMAYQQQHFISQDPWVLAKLLAIIPISAAFYSSIMLGISSLFSQGRLAGAVFAGIYFLSNFFTVAMNIVYHIMLENGRRGHTKNPGQDLVGWLFYGSVDGINIGLSKAILGTNGSFPFAAAVQARMVPAPPLVPVLIIMALISGIMLLIAWSKVRAVEVIGS